MKTPMKDRSFRGQSLVEWALILPVFLLLLMAIIDLGRVTYTYSALFNSTREGARYGIIHPNDTSGITSTVRSLSVGLDPALITVIATRPTTRTIRVFATYQFTVVTPFASAILGSQSIILRTQTTMRVEQ